jgi:hypothetical protein
MAGNVAPNTITDGLVFYLDAANTKSYVSGSTTWTDISGFQRNGTLTNGPTFSTGSGGSIVFDGTNDNVTTSAIVSLGNTFTVNAWIRLNNIAGGAASRKTIVANDYPYLAGRGFLFVASGNNGSDFFVSLGNDQKVAVTSTGLISANTVYMLSLRVNSTDPIRLYRNGVEAPSYTVQNDGNVSLTYSNPCVFGIRSANDPFNGDMYNIQMYNRALSATEILQNYNAMKGRYGL